ncbi:MAG: hypothetical protein K2O67_05810, partial [Clostridia bacterium]|nr:hypothetical protein [Clostridia bacterium]
IIRGNNMQKNTNEHICKNCKYYVEHYVILSCVQLSAIGGHCRKEEIYDFDSKELFVPPCNCHHWESNENLLIKRQNTIRGLLQCMEKRLKDIQLILSK